LSFADREGVWAASVQGIGALQEAQLTFFDRKKMQYLPIPVSLQVEVLSLAGNLAKKDGKPAAHLHAVLGRQDGLAIGGHFAGGKAWPTLELVVIELGEGQLIREKDQETGLSLLKP
jgi:uncharacterized protein